MKAEQLPKRHEKLNKKIWVVKGKVPYKPCSAPSLRQQGPAELEASATSRVTWRIPDLLLSLKQGTVLLPGQRDTAQHLPFPNLTLGVVGKAACHCGSRARAVWRGMRNPICVVSTSAVPGVTKHTLLIWEDPCQMLGHSESARLC